MPVCEKCGKPIVWAEDDHGQRIPLDPRPPVYVIETFVQRGGRTVPKVRKMSNPRGYVSHFATCAQAEYFAGRNRVKSSGKPVAENQPRLIS